ncbi:MAG: DNA topology modulation protein [Candidatus Eremiobacterota bacterium]
MKKILILGCSGSGKTTLALELGNILNLEVIHLDRLYWNPGWVSTPEDEWLEIIKDIIKKDRWIIEGNYSGTIDMRLNEADTAIYLDFPRIICLWQAIKRWLLHMGHNRPDVGEGCKEKIDLEFMMWIWNFNRTHREMMLGKLGQQKYKKNIYILKNHKDAADFLNKVTGNSS